MPVDLTKFRSEVEAGHGLLAEFRTTGATEPGRDLLRDWVPDILATSSALADEVESLREIVMEPVQACPGCGAVFPMRGEHRCPGWAFSGREGGHEVAADIERAEALRRGIAFLARHRRREGLVPLHDLIRLLEGDARTLEDRERIRKAVAP